MKVNKITVIIDKPIEEVFEFTTNPKNTHLWIDSISEEVTDEYPPKVGTEYKNRGENSDWGTYTVIEFEENKLFTLKSLDGDYLVRYTYKDLGNGSTEMVYAEEGELDNPFTEEVLLKLKSVMESENRVMQVSSVKEFELQLENGNLKGVIENPGQEKLVILVHGFTGDMRGPSDIFLKFSPQLQEAGYSVLRFSFLGTPPSGGEYQDMTVARQEQELQAVIGFARENGYQNVCLLGESMGVVALGIYDSSIAAMVLWWPAVDFEDTEFKDYLSGDYQEQIKEKGYFMDGDFRIGKQFVDEIPEINYLDTIPKVKCPILFVHGQKDSDVPLAQVEKAFELAQEPKQLHVIPGEDHCCRNKQDEVMDVSLEFMKKHF